MKQSLLCYLMFLSFCICMGAAPVAEGQTMYSWTDENGVVHFSDSKPEGQQAEERSIPSGPQSSGVGTDQGTDQGTAYDPSLAQQKRDELALKHQEAQVNDVVNSAQCSSWQAEVDRIEPNRRVFFTNEKGETERMDDVVRTNRVAELKSQIAKNCK